MDYSSLPNDPDHPVGSSPWQSSPQAAPHFGTPEPGSAPSSPLAKHSAASTDGSPRQSEDENGHDVNGRQQQRADDVPSAGEGSPQDTADRTRGPPLNSGGFQGQQYQQHTQNSQQSRQQPGYPYQQQQQQQPRSAVPSRYHTGARPNQRHHLPQYKLQAKITGLERTGRKDPVLRFDVHVSREISPGVVSALTISSDKSTKVSDYSI